MTIYDIAKSAGVSASTVSRIINHKEGVRESTRRRVEALLREHHYSPNETARGLVNQATRIIGILLMDIRTLHHTDGVYYIERELEKLGYCCIIMNSGSTDAEKAEYIRRLSRRRVEGAILIGSGFQNDTVRQAISEYLPDTPVVLVNGRLDLPNVYGVLSDERSGMERCVERLVAAGHVHPAFVIDTQTPSNLLKRAGYEQGVLRCCPGYAPVVVHSGSSLAEAADATRALMREHPQVDGILYAVDLLAIGGIRALLEMGRKVPDEVAVIGVDNSIYAEICTPRLTSLDNKLLDTSITAAQTLIQVLQSNRAPKNVMIMSTIAERETG